MSDEGTPIRKVVRDGKVAVLYSPGFGAGWSTWSEPSNASVFWPEVVEWVEAGKPESDGGIDSILARLGFPHFYTGGADDLTIEWVDQGEMFEIDEYDGNESVRVIGKISFLVA